MTTYDAVTPPPLPPRPLRGFWPTFTWGVTRVVRWNKVLIVAAAAVGFGLLVGLQIRGHGDAAKALALVLDRAVLSFGLPVLALLLAGEGFAYEVQARTLVYHLVRPVRRTTLFLSRFLAGYVPAALVAAAALVALILASGVPFTPRAWATILVTAGLGMLTLAAIYYTLGALFKNGFVAGLIYTFFVEAMLSNVPGSMQQYSIMYHVRSLHHHVTEGVLPTLPAAMRRGLIPEELRKALATDAEPTAAVVTLLAVAGVALALGAWRTARRDFALK